MCHVDRDTVTGRADVDRQTIHVHDILNDSGTSIPLHGNSRSARQSDGTRRTTASTGCSVGAILIRRMEVRPFSDKQIKLLETFADQAVIAIENARLFQELQSAIAITEALEQQTATSEILGVIARSPTDIQPVLETIAERAARVCGANDAVIRLVEGNMLRLAAHYGPVPMLPSERTDRSPIAGWPRRCRSPTHPHR